MMSCIYARAFLASNSQIHETCARSSSLQHHGRDTTGCKQASNVSEVKLTQYMCQRIDLIGVHHRRKKYIQASTVNLRETESQSVALLV